MYRLSIQRRAIATSQVAEPPLIMSIAEFRMAGRNARVIEDDGRPRLSPNGDIVLQEKHYSLDK